MVANVLPATEPNAEKWVGRESEVLQVLLQTQKSSSSLLGW